MVKRLIRLKYQPIILKETFQVIALYKQHILQQKNLHLQLSVAQINGKLYSYDQSNDYLNLTKSMMPKHLEKFVDFHYSELVLDKIDEIDVSLYKNLEIKIDDSASMEIAIRSRGTPRISIRLLKRAIDFSIVENLDFINLKIVKESLEQPQRLFLNI